nr:hypothetical protein Iba_chr14aCG23350 [Ipomoea batatas]
MAYGSGERKKAQQRKRLKTKKRSGTCRRHRRSSIVRRTDPSSTDRSEPPSPSEQAVRRDSVAISLYNRIPKLFYVAAVGSRSCGSIQIVQGGLGFLDGTIRSFKQALARERALFFVRPTRGLNKLRSLI